MLRKRDKNKTFKIYSLINGYVAVWTARELELHFQKINHNTPKIARGTSAQLKRQINEVFDVLRERPFQVDRLLIKQVK